MRNRLSMLGIVSVILTFGVFFVGCNDDSTTTYTVTFNTNGGSAVTAIKGITSGSTITLPNNPTRENDTFGGWFIDNETFLDEFTSVTPVIQDITVYAKWVPTIVAYDGQIFNLEVVGDAFSEGSIYSGPNENIKTKNDFSWNDSWDDETGRWIVAGTVNSGKVELSLPETVSDEILAPGDNKDIGYFGRMKLTSGELRLYNLPDLTTWIFFIYSKTASSTYESKELKMGWNIFKVSGEENEEEYAIIDSLEAVYNQGFKWYFYTPE
jgi:uncharacterized repeat protein (TIGR02543 family)